MSDKKTLLQQGNKTTALRTVRQPFGFQSLQMRLSFSYVWVTVVFVFLLEILVILLLALVASSNAVETSALNVKRIALEYAYAASLRADHSPLTMHISFQPGQPGSLTSTSEEPPGAYDIFQANQRTPASDPAAFALLIAPDGRVIASSAAVRYSPNRQVIQLLPKQSQVIMEALHHGVPQERVSLPSSEGNITYAIEMVWSRDQRVLGGIYIQERLPTQAQMVFNGFRMIWPIVLTSCLLLLMITTPIGSLFGLAMTRNLIKRLRRLVAATQSFAEGDYTQRVQVIRSDEIGHLEEHFNDMAQQVSSSITLHRELAEENARIRERARISRELHDSISQDLFSLRTLVNGLQSAIQAEKRAQEMQPYVDMVAETMMNMTREMRALLLEMRPPRLDGIPFIDALEELASAYTVRVGITVTTDFAPVALDTRSEECLLRIVQEALTNAARHANATAITLILMSQHAQTILTISDNGQGFHHEKHKRTPGLGLHSMQERVQALGGEFVLDTAPGQGTRLQVFLPQVRGTQR